MFEVGVGARLPMVPPVTTPLKRSSQYNFTFLAQGENKSKKYNLVQINTACNSIDWMINDRLTCKN